MSWRGVKKSISRLPHQLKTRNGGEDVTKDLEFDTLEQCYKELVKSTEDLRLEVIAYRDSLANMLSYQMGCANLIAEVCGLSPTNEEDLSDSIIFAGQQETMPLEIKQCLEDYATAMTYCKQEVYAVLDKIDGNVLGPLDRFHEIARTINKTIVKRDHKLIDYDRHRLSYMKYADIQYPTPSEEKNMFKLQTLYDNAACDYDYFNTMLKKELAVFTDLLRDKLLQPIIKNFYNAQCRAVGGIYGRLYEVIQQNETILRTLNMPIEEGFNLRLAEENARAELDKLELFKKGLKPWQQKDPSSTRYRSSRVSLQVRDNKESDNEEDNSSPSVNRCYTSSDRNYSTSRKQFNGNDAFEETLLSVPEGDNDSSINNDSPALSPRPSVAALRSKLLSTSTSTAAPPPYQESEKQPQPLKSQHQTEKATFSSKSSSRSSLLSAGLTSNSSTTPTTPSDQQSTVGTSPFADQQIEMIAKKKRPPPPPPSKKFSRDESKHKKEMVEALYDLKGPQEGDLSFKMGDLIEVLEKSEEVNDWWKGRLNGQVGMFPANYVKQV